MRPSSTSSEGRWVAAPSGSVIAPQLFPFERTARRTQRNVKYWSSSEMGLRWTAAGMLEAELQFRNVIGHSDLVKLAIAIERDLSHRHQAHPSPMIDPATSAAGSG